MENIKKALRCLLHETAAKNERVYTALGDEVKLTEYSPMGDIWTDALSRALSEHKTVIIPRADTPYRINSTVIIPSDRRILAEDGAVIRLIEGTNVLMLRNENTADGTHAPIRDVERDCNISIEGGIWEESCEKRMGYGKTGMYDKERSFYGVSTCMFFENLDRLTLKNMTFRNCGGFAVQLGEISNVIIKNIRFVNCFADGIHVNGNTKNIHIRNVSGHVGDDLVAFNMYDWQNSSVNFGPCKNVICEELCQSPDSPYKALRIETGVYTFDDGSTIDCSLTNALFRKIENIRTFKLYCQTPPYRPEDKPEPAAVGSGDNIIFEDIRVDLTEPIDPLPNYLNSHPITGSIAAFELGLNIKDLYFKNIDVTLHRDQYPYSYLMCIGPKSSRTEDGIEIFDPYFSSIAETVYLENVKINGEKVTDAAPYIREITFDRLYEDIPSTASGRIKQIVMCGGKNENR